MRSNDRYVSGLRQLSLHREIVEGDRVQIRVHRSALVVGIATIVLAGTAWGWMSAFAQEAATPTLRVSSRETVVDVTAIDAQGRPVHGLTQDEITVMEDGKPQPVRHFEEVRSHWVEPMRNLPPNVYSSQQPQSPSSAVNILLLDLENEAPVDSTDHQQVSQSIAMQHYVKEAAKQAIQNMPDGTRIAVLAMTYNLRILQSFTADRELLKTAIDAVPYDLNGNGIIQMDMRGTGSHRTMPNDTDGNSDKQCLQANNRNQSVLEALDRIAQDTLPIHGRKNLIWFTVGIPQITDPNSRPSCLPNYSLGLSHAYDLLAASQVSVYPVDAIGVDKLGARQLSEQMVAEATGGVAYSETNDRTSAVLKAIDNGANYYSIAYVPPAGKNNGAYRKIDVKVDRPDVKLTFRKGYYADDLTKLKMAPGLTFSLTAPPAPKGDMKAPMSRGLATSSDILFDVEVLPSTVVPKPGDPPVMGTLDPKLQGRRLTRYGFDYQVPVQQVAFKDGKKKTHDSEIDFDIAVYDSNDKLLTGLNQTLKSSLTESTYQKMIADKVPLKFFQQIDLPTGILFLRVGVLDRVSDKTGTLELPLKISRKQ